MFVGVQDISKSDVKGSHTPFAAVGCRIVKEFRQVALMRFTQIDYALIPTSQSRSS